jgi:hypothetical protein
MSDAVDADTVYRTLQRGRRLREQHVGPLFSNEREAKRAVEHFVKTEHSATPTEWEDADHGVKMLPEDSRSEFLVVPTTVRNSLDELLDADDVDDGQEVEAVAD